MDDLQAIQGARSQGPRNREQQIELPKSNTLLLHDLSELRHSDQRLCLN